MFPAVPADEVEKTTRPPQRPPAKEKKDASFIALYNGKQMLAYFFCLALYY